MRHLLIIPSFFMISSCALFGLQNQCTIDYRENRQLIIPPSIEDGIKDSKAVSEKKL